MPKESHGDKAPKQLDQGEVRTYEIDLIIDHLLKYNIGVEVKSHFQYDSLKILCYVPVEQTRCVMGKYQACHSISQSLFNSVMKSIWFSLPGQYLLA